MVQYYLGSFGSLTAAMRDLLYHILCLEYENFMKYSLSNCNQVQDKTKICARMPRRGGCCEGNPDVTPRDEIFTNFKMKISIFIEIERAARLM